MTPSIHGECWAADVAVVGLLGDMRPCGSRCTKLLPKLSMPCVCASLGCTEPRSTACRETG